MPQTLIIAVLYGLAMAMALPAQDADPSVRCRFDFHGFGNLESFRQFDDELKTALKTNDVAMLTQLVSFPMTVNEAGETAISRPSALASRIDEIFTPEVRKAVIDQEPEEIFCNWNGIMYGNGEVWIYAYGERYGVWIVNVKDSKRSKPDGATQVQFTCWAEEFRARIQEDSESNRYLLIWTRPRSIKDEPDARLTDGEVEYSGSGMCAHPVWAFQSGEETYEAMTGGCHSDSDPPPEGSTGSMTITRAGVEVHHWCY